MLPKIKVGIATVITVGLTAFGQSASAVTVNSFSSFNMPYGVAVDSSGNVFVADTGNSLITEFNPITGTSSPSFSTSSSTFSPYGVAVDSSGNVFVADSGTNSIVEFNPTHSNFTSFGALGTGTNQFNDPTGVAVDASGNVYVADGVNNRIVEFNPTKNFDSNNFTVLGTSGQFSTPEGVAVDAKGDIFVADTGNNRIVEYNLTSSTFTSFGTLGSGGGQFNDPSGVAVANNGNVYVADYLNNRIDVFNPSSFSSSFNSFESSNFAPFSVALDAKNGIIYAADPADPTDPGSIVQLTSGGAGPNLPGVTPGFPLTTVPEPSEVLGILALGLCGLSARFRRSNCGRKQAE